MNTTTETNNTHSEIEKIINVIKQEAQAIWGERWFKEIVHQYCKVEQLETGKTITYSDRNRQLSRLLKEGQTGNMITLFRLAKCVDLKIDVSKRLMSSKQ
ncbi:MAG: hypothetical protein AB4057_00310 [Crocosphaera sp.]